MGSASASMYLPSYVWKHDLNVGIPMSIISISNNKDMEKFPLSKIANGDVQTYYNPRACLVVLPYALSTCAPLTMRRFKALQVMIQMTFGNFLLYKVKCFLNDGRKGNSI